MKKEELKTLFKKYAEGTCTDEEKAMLEAWYLQHNEPGPIIRKASIYAAKNLIFLKLPGNESNFPKIGIRLAAAAVIIGILITVALVVLNSGKPKIENKVTIDIPPGTNKATLTSGKGLKVNLTDAKIGTITNKAGLVITKSKSGQVSFVMTHAEKIDHSPNTINVPAGGQWQVELSDGTHIWLNSASKLTFPASFAQLENRIVSLEGEGYFEVAKDAVHPFVVISGNQRVEVLGTHFNINHYTDEPDIKTTLLEGKIKIRLLGMKNSSMVKPGEQATVNGSDIAIKPVDVDEAIAWKEGNFRFDNEPIKSAMRKISRWYDVEVQYQGPVYGERLDGIVSRNKNISQVIKALEATKTVHFKLEGRRVTVMK